jgi:(2Fe-2S) ferredoxin
VGLHAFFKKEVERLGLKGIVRANKAGCLDQCEYGPSVVIYPEGVWYWVGKEADVTEIMEGKMAAFLWSNPKNLGSLLENTENGHSPYFIANQPITRRSLLWAMKKSGKPTYKR